MERFIAQFEGPITFLYLAPYTQRPPKGDLHSLKDAKEIELAALAISGMIESYKSVRQGVHAPADWHQLIVTKWDEHSAKEAVTADRAQYDQDAIDEFLSSNYGDGYNKWKNLTKSRGISAKGYTAGITDEEGVVHFSKGSDLRETLNGYPIGLWTRLYRNALAAADGPDISPFPQAPSASPFRIAINRVLRLMTGH